MDYYISHIYPKISKDTIVFTGNCGLVWAGYSVSGIYIPDVLTNIPELKDMRLAGYVNYCYTTTPVDTEHYVKPFRDNPLVLVPTIERAIVENIKYDLEFIDEGYFCDSFERYQHTKEYFNYNLLMEVADFFKVDRAKVDYWLEESSDYNSF